MGKKCIISYYYNEPWAALLGGSVVNNCLTSDYQYDQNKEGKGDRQLYNPPGALDSVRNTTKDQNPYYQSGKEYFPVERAIKVNWVGSCRENSYVLLL